MTASQTQHQEATAVLDSLGLTAVDGGGRSRSPSNSLPVVARNEDGRCFLLKYYLPPRDDSVLPSGVTADDYIWRETGFYRVLDRVDPGRRDLPAPRTIAIGPGQPPSWILLQHLAPAVGPREEVLGQDHVVELLDKLAAMSTDHLLGRRGFPFAHWDPAAYLEQVRTMYDALLFVLGESRWRKVQSFFAEALRWTEGRRRVLVHGDFLEENILVDAEGRPFLVDFENVGIGNEDHDMAWFWIHSDRHPEWKRQLMRRWLGRHVGGDRIRTEWGLRTAISYLALRRLRWSYLTHGDEDPRQSRNLALLDAALDGGSSLFPRD
ncbi:MAG: aminoglycoside phosphotransferase family protein [Planctomycetes bacterium]|nr:aminoglycoside phosphotransferase family protein [Planctomycetota bacterium]